MGDPAPARAIVLGQGAAGLTAALTIAREGIPVVCLSKVRPGAATCTLYAGGGFTLGLGGMTPEEHKELTLRTGRFLCRDELLDVFCHRASGIVQLLESIGLGFKTRNGGLSVDKDPRFPLLGGKKLLDHLKSACTGAGVQFFSNIVATRILADDRGVLGVECIDYETGREEILRAGAVVLATGGGGWIYQRTENPQRITGDGYRLAFLAGCTLSDMEFVQFYPIGIDIPGGAHWFIDLSIMDLARVTNSRGEEFLKEKLRSEGIHNGREANLFARDKCTVWISLEARNGPVLFHLEDVDPALLSSGWVSGPGRKVETGFCRRIPGSFSRNSWRFVRDFVFGDALGEKRGGMDVRMGERPRGPARIEKGTPLLSIALPSAGERRRRTQDLYTGPGEVQGNAFSSASVRFQRPAGGLRKPRAMVHDFLRYSGSAHPA